MSSPTSSAYRCMQSPLWLPSVSQIRASFVTLGFVDSVLPKVLALHNIVQGKGGGD